MNMRHEHGFTLWELLMTLLVAGILLGVGIPNVMEFQRSGAMTAAANDFVTGVLMARTEAVKRQVPVALCLSDNPTDPVPTCSPNAIADSATRGFVVFVDENGDTDAFGNPDLTDATDGNAAIDAGEAILMRSVPPGGSIRVSATCGNYSFGTNGWVRQAGALCAATLGAAAASTFNTAQFITYCDDRGRRLTGGQLSSARAVRVDSTGRAIVLQEAAPVNTALGLTAATCP